MRVLFLLTIDLNINGPSVHLLKDIIDSTKRKKISVDVIQKKYSLKKEWSIYEEQCNGGLISQILCKKPQGLSFIKRYLDEIKYSKVCKSIYRNKKYDLVFLQSCNTAWSHCKYLKKYLNCKIVFNVQDIFPLDMVYEEIISNKSILYKFFYIQQKKAYKCVDLVITISDDMKQSLLNILPNMNIDVIYNWEYQNKFNNSDYEYVQSTYFDNKFFNVVYAGNIGKAQDIRTLLEAAKILNDSNMIRFIIIGSGSEKENCIKFINKEKLKNVLMYDLLPQNYSKYIYKSSSINIIPLKKGIIHTSLPSKTATCFNSKKPFVYFAESNDCIYNILKNNPFSIICDAGNPQMLADIITKASKTNYSQFQSPMFKEVVKKNSPNYYVDDFVLITEGKENND